MTTIQQKQCRDQCMELIAGNEDIFFFKSTQMLSPLKHHAKLHHFLMTTAAALSFQTLITVETFYQLCFSCFLIPGRFVRLLVKTVQCSEERSFFSDALLTNTCTHITSCRLYSESCSEAQELCLLAEYLYINHLLFTSVFIPANFKYFIK